MQSVSAKNERFTWCDTGRPTSLIAPPPPGREKQRRLGRGRVRDQSNGADISRSILTSHAWGFPLPNGGNTIAAHAGRGENARLERTQLERDSSGARSVAPTSSRGGLVLASGRLTRRGAGACAVLTLRIVKSFRSRRSFISLSLRSDVIR